MPNTTANLSSAAALQAPRLHAHIVRFPRTALTLAGLAVVAGSALQAAALVPAAGPAAIHPRPAASTQWPKLNPARLHRTVAAAPVAQDDQDDQDAEDGPPAEPVLEQIPIAAASEPQSLAVSEQTLGARTQIEDRQVSGRLHRSPDVRGASRALGT